MSSSPIDMYLVRHGDARFMWGQDEDPSLSQMGLDQARALAARHTELAGCPILTSPMRRAQETGQVLAEAWGSSRQMIEDLSEIPPPSGLDEQGRRDWIRQAEAKTWTEMSESYVSWRDGVVSWLRSRRSSFVAVTHTFFINAALGDATSDPHVVIFWPENCSLTHIRSGNDVFELVSRGDVGHSVLDDRADPPSL